MKRISGSMRTVPLVYERGLRAREVRVVDAPTYFVGEEGVVLGIRLRLRIDDRELSLEEEAALAAEIAALGEVVPRDHDSARVGADLVVRCPQGRVRLERAV